MFAFNVTYILRIESDSLTNCEFLRKRYINFISMNGFNSECASLFLLHPHRV